MKTKEKKRTENLESLCFFIFLTLMLSSTAMLLLHQPLFASICSSIGAALITLCFLKPRKIRHPKLYAFGRTLIITGCVLSFVAAILMLVIYLFNL